MIVDLDKHIVQYERRLVMYEACQHFDMLKCITILDTYDIGDTSIEFLDVDEMLASLDNATLIWC